MSTPYDNFVYALNAKETKRQYPHRLDKFLPSFGNVHNPSEISVSILQTRILRDKFVWIIRTQRESKK